MAKITFGNGITNIRGKLGGDVYSRNRGGAYKKINASPTGTPTTYQIQAKANFSAISPLWSSVLSDNERRAWNNAASNFLYNDLFGENKMLSGYNLFKKINGNTLLVGNPTVTLPPIKSSIRLTTPNIIYAESGSNTIKFEWTPDPLDSDEWLMIWLTEQLPIGQSYYRNKIKFLTFLPPGTSGSQDLSPFYNPRFGALTLGMRIFCETWIMNGFTGLVGAKSQTSIIIT